jgi:hypothetical protein
MNPRLAALLLCLALWFAAATDYVPAFIDAQGKVFGLFKLDIYKDALHVASATMFLKIFGALYFLDGVMGTFTGSGFLDLSIFTQGVLGIPVWIKFLSSVPHLFLGAFGIATGWFGERLAIGGRA